jgi:cytochrome P450 family 4
MKFAMLEMKAILSAVLRRYQLLPASPPHQLDLTVVLVLKSLTGVVLRLQPRIPLAATNCADDGH